MASALTAAADRVLALVAAARRLRDPADPLGRRARELLAATTPHSPEGIELALSRCLETSPAHADVEALCASVSQVPRAHVVLSAEPFVAAHRAIALALAASSTVCVRPSRREPHMASLLAAAGGEFEIVEALAPSAGDHVWAYGSDQSLAEVDALLPAGVVLHGHGAGFGVAVVTEEDDPSAAARLLVDDVVVLDQRGCASPRVVVFRGDEEAARRLGVALANALGAAERAVPRGRETDEDLAEVRRYRDAVTIAGAAFAAGRGVVGVSRAVHAAPQRRCLHVARFDAEDDVAHAVSRVASGITILGGSGGLLARLAREAPRARLAALGSMQTPPFDGPVDRRGWSPPVSS